MTAYPLTIYGVWLRRLLAFVVPLAFVSYFPAVAILGKHDPLDTPPWLGALTPVVAGLTVVIAAAIWRTGVRHYRSTGS